MIGRAGRSGFCVKGESILMFKDGDKKKVHKNVTKYCTTTVHANNYYSNVVLQKRARCPLSAHSLLNFQQMSFKSI